MLFALLVACSSPAPTPAPAPAPAAPAAPAAPKNQIVVKGSDSEVNLVQKIGEDFMKTHADVSLSVTGGGSGTGIAALLDGTATLANSSRDLKGEEKVKFQEKGLSPESFVFATDAVAIIVNASNPVDKLTVDQLGAAFRGESASWKALGGEDKPVSLYGRQSSSGTYDYIKSTLVKGEYATTLKQMNGNAQIADGVGADPTGIGYVAAGYVKDAKGVKVVSILVDGAPISPLDEAAVMAGKYPLARPLYQFMNGKPTGSLKDFLAYEASEAGQKTVKDMGFYAIFPDKQAANAALLGN